MAWMIGIDEAGYGPNLGPFVMSSVTCSVPDALVGGDLWTHLGDSVYHGKTKKNETRVLVDDSKVVFNSDRGTAQLEAGVIGLLGRNPEHPTLKDYLEAHCLEGFAELVAEKWFVGKSLVPMDAEGHLLDETTESFRSCCDKADVASWSMRTVVVSPPRFNELVEAGDSKGAVLAHTLGVLLRDYKNLADDEPIHVFVDKHGGRNTYSAMLQDAFGEGMVMAREEGAQRSTYQVLGLDRDIHVTIQPRADATHFHVALASMASKYFRERLMFEFNDFWRKHLPKLKPTAGYPTDASRFLDDIRETAKKLGLDESALWRKR